MPRKHRKKTGILKRVLTSIHKTAKDHFIPHSGNNHTPHVLHHRALFGYSVVLVLLKVLVVTVSISFPAASLLSSAITPTNIISLTNGTRRSLDLPELEVDPKLMQAAQAKAEDMFLNGYFAHTSPDGVTPWYWFKTFGYNYRSAGENLAAHFTEAEDVQAGWMASPTHRDNIVSDRYNEIGVGVAQGVFDNYQTTFVVQMFGYELDQEPAVDENIATTEPEPQPTEVAIEPEPTPAVPADTIVTTPSTAETFTVASAPTSPEPDTVLAEVAEDPNALVIDINSLTLKPIEHGYAAEISMKNVSEAVLYMGNTRVPFVMSSTPDVWQSVIFYDAATMSSEGERLYLVAGSPDGEQQIVDLAWIMPGSTAPEVYAFRGADAPKLLGVMDVANIDDNVQKIYLFTLIFLSAALLVAIFVKIEVQKPSMIAHGLAVLALALLLSVF